ncbi:MAG: IS110 family transposase [Hymenobacteraceae bacterium]|nr:IS110 family transposase [Hymenobacteraceae bacterium]
MKVIKQSVSADISKDKFDACFSVLTQEHRVVVKASRCFPNSPKGFAEFSKWVSSREDPLTELVVIMEATGVYYEHLAWSLYQAGRKVIVVLPNRAKQFAQSLGCKSKNDRIDARALAHMGAERNLEPWQPMSQQLYLLRKLTREHEQVQQMRTEATNRLHAESHSMLASKSTVKRLRKTLQLYEAQLQAIQQEIRAVIDSDALLKAKVEKVTTIKGVGLLTAATVIAETNGFALFTSHKQLTSYAGYDVVENQSGKRSGKTKISKQGNSHIRRILHMPAFNAVSRNVPVCRALYERLTGKGKKKMVAYVAVQKKLLALIYTLWKRDEAWQEDRYQQQTEECIQSLEAGASLSGVSAADRNTVAPAVARATQDKHPVPVGPGALFQVRER